MNVKWDIKLKDWQKENPILYTEKKIPTRYKSAVAFFFYGVNTLLCNRPSVQNIDPSFPKFDHSVQNLNHNHNFKITTTNMPPGLSPVVRKIALLKKT